MEKKICSKCGEEKMITEFSFKNKKLNCRNNKCRKCHNEYLLVYKKNNRKKLSEKRKEYYEKNKVSHLEYRKKYNEKNKVLISEYNKKYREKNRGRFNDRQKVRRKTEPLFKLKCSIRSRILTAFKQKGYSKKSKTHQILGCSFEELKIHLEVMFEPWMSWDNFGIYNGDLNYGWDIDHIIPLSSAETEEDVIRLNHYTNLQPLCSRTNRNIKRDRLDWSPE